MLATVAPGAGVEAIAEQFDECLFIDRIGNTPGGAGDEHRTDIRTVTGFVHADNNA